MRVGGRAVTKAGALVDQAADVELIAPDHPYVGRGGLKLAHALDTFGIAVTGREALDIGASTGGFTDVLLQRGATRVVALDVGHGQLDWALRTDPRVVVIEHFNARRLTPADLPGPCDVVVIDVSFISLRHILPVVAARCSARRRRRGAGEAAVRGRARRCAKGRRPRPSRARRGWSRDIVAAALR